MSIKRLNLKEIQAIYGVLIMRKVRIISVLIMSRHSICFYRS